MSTFGHYFRVTTYGESHCASVGAIIDGCPPGLPLSASTDIQPQMTRRRPGQSAITTPRDEKDRVEIQSGTEEGVTLGTPIGVRVLNENQRPKDYGNSTMDRFPRPSHADWTYLEKYGVRASSGGGRASARETIGRVAAGAIAEKYLRVAYGIEIVAFVSSIGTEFLFPPTATHPTHATNPSYLSLLSTITRDIVDDPAHLPVRCPDPAAADRMRKLVESFRDAQDSIGGTVTCVVRNAPTGLGEPCFDKLEATLAHAMLSIPATKGFEIGSGFGGCRVPGSIHNDPFVRSVPVPTAGTSLPPATTTTTTDGEEEAVPLGKRIPYLTTTTNNSGGIQGGISNGAPIHFTVAFKPPATIGQAQRTEPYENSSLSSSSTTTPATATNGASSSTPTSEEEQAAKMKKQTEQESILEAKGRHDPCVVPRAVPIVEAMAALVIMDAVLAQQARQRSRELLPALRDLGVGGAVRRV